jgi:hypothetical protein
MGREISASSKFLGTVRVQAHSAGRDALSKAYSTCAILLDLTPT